MNGLSKQASAFIQGLNRGNCASPALVTKALSAMGLRNDLWVSFHTHYGGLLVPASQSEVIRYGLAFDDSDWTESDELVVEDDRGRLRIYCSDAHPSHECWLYEDGQWSGFGTRARSFEVKLERDWLVSRAHQAGAQFTSRLEPPSKEKMDLVDEASDQFFKFFRLERGLVVTQPDSPRVSVWSSDVPLWV